MIICVSANPAIDRRVRVKTLTPGAVNRAVSAESIAGGKAAHVAMAVKALGEEVVWIGFIGGASGDELERQMTEIDIRVIAVRTAARTRTNDEIIDAVGNITEILEPGGPVTAGELLLMYSACRSEMAAAAAPFQLVLSGSLPPNVPADLYSDLIADARKFGGGSILDTSGMALLDAIRAAPDLAKPNREEAENAVGFKIDGTTAAIAAAERLLGFGAAAVSISLGGDGMVWTDGNMSVLAVPPSVDVNSTVGCGDAAVAGFAVAALRHLDKHESIRLAVTCGTANCLANRPGQISAGDVRRLLPLVKITEISNAAKAAQEVK